MIYGIIFGLTIIIAALTRELFPFHFVLLGGIVCIGIVALLKVQAIRRASSPAPTPGTSAATGSGAATATASATPTLPTSPAPATATAPRPTRSTAGRNWIIALLAVIIIFWLVIPALRTTAPPPQSATPNRDLQRRVITRNFTFVGGDDFDERQGYVEIRKGGRAIFAIYDAPWRRDAIFRIVVSLRQQSTGNLVLKINGGRGGQKFFLVPGSTTFGNAVFFEKEEVGRHEYFNPNGGNQIILSSQGGDMDIQFVSIVMIYDE